jgi:hypothetical protein
MSFVTESMVNVVFDEFAAIETDPESVRSPKLLLALNDMLLLADAMISLDATKIASFVTESNFKDTFE